MLISASMLSADFATLGAEAAAISAAGTDWVHMDCFDGQFVPNLTFGPAVIQAIRPYTPLPLDVHYMAHNPEQYIEPTAAAGADRMTIHLEATADPATALKNIHQAGMATGLALRVETPAEAVKPYLSQLDQILVMTVRGGFGGDPFQPAMLTKTAQLRSWLEDMPAAERPLLAVDGGVSAETAPLLAKAGADVLCAGSAVFGKPRNPEAYAANIQLLRKSAESPIEGA